jgi:hypothetical protein
LGVTSPSSKPPSRAASKQWSAPTPGGGGSTSSIQLASSTRSTATKKLSLAEITNRREKGPCSKCDEQFVPCHHDVCKRLFTIELIDDCDDKEGLTISLHVLTGIQPRSGRTMQVMVLINGAHLFALLDSRSTHNFVDSAAATRVGLTLTEQFSLRIGIANGDRVPSPGCCRGLYISISGEPFSIYCYSSTWAPSTWY